MSETNESRVRRRGCRGHRFRVGRVQAFLRGKVWYLCYHEHGQRRRPRVGPNKNVARQLAARISGQLEIGAPAALSFEPICITDLRDQWLSYHEHVLRSSLCTIQRYRTATEHFLRYVQSVQPVKLASHFHLTHAEQFVVHLRSLRFAANGHPNTAKRPLLDKGILYIRETCRSPFTFAMKRRHLSPYAENPFSALQLDRLPIEHTRRLVLPTPVPQEALLPSGHRVVAESYCSPAELERMT